MASGTKATVRRDGPAHWQEWDRDQEVGGPNGHVYSDNPLSLQQGKQLRETPELIRRAEVGRLQDEARRLKAKVLRLEQVLIDERG